MSYVSTLAVEWIEIVSRLACGFCGTGSPPSRWSGLKLGVVAALIALAAIVSTLAVEWIEIFGVQEYTANPFRLHPRGGVD